MYFSDEGKCVILCIFLLFFQVTMYISDKGKYAIVYVFNFSCQLMCTLVIKVNVLVYMFLTSLAS